ncbi:KamA family protein [Actinopolyspora biskrensis]|uniref:KamA family protein n=1 Tax=Actinopolyspora biskrensis TaxID=1470178 RepID=A0A852Z5B1_9ACTN|nr:lysine 2,3-aminomutase [Actinopolyspora biskrensis]NYH77423.1 KamA family protein [Actinopolyspora biskrensis]
MNLPGATETMRYRAYGPRHLSEIASRFSLDAEFLRNAQLVCRVIPFRVNEYVLSEMIDWDAVPDDPMFQMLFPQPGMLSDADVQRLEEAVADGKRAERDTVRQIQARLNPHPSGQREFNVPLLGGESTSGLQHKYRETILYFPQQGQTCHAYCTYCFRWAQFVGDSEIRFAAVEPSQLVAYLADHPEVEDVLVTGGDPMMMSTERLREHIEPLLSVPTVRCIRIGTKALAYWPYRFVDDEDADDLLRLFERVIDSGRNLAVMAHVSHGRELGTDVVREAVSRLRATGALIFCQAPLVARVNDAPSVWSDMWRAQLAMGALPYYMFVERDTGPHDYFKVPLSDAVAIFQTAYSSLPGLARTVRGPVMSTTPGKIVIDGVEQSPDGRFFRMRFLQARNAGLVGRPFRAPFSEHASWLSEIGPLTADTPDDIAKAVRSAGESQ